MTNGKHATRFTQYNEPFDLSDMTRVGADLLGRAAFVFSVGPGTREVIPGDGIPAQDSTIEVHGMSIPAAIYCLNECISILERIHEDREQEQQ